MLLIPDPTLFVWSPESGQQWEEEGPALIVIWWLLWAIKPGTKDVTFIVSSDLTSSWLGPAGQGRRGCFPPRWWSWSSCSTGSPVSLVWGAGSRGWCSLAVGSFLGTLRESLLWGSASYCEGWSGSSSFLALTSLTRGNIGWFTFLSYFSISFECKSPLLFWHLSHSHYK